MNICLIIIIRLLGFKYEILWVSNYDKRKSTQSYFNVSNAIQSVYCGHVRQNRK